MNVPPYPFAFPVGPGPDPHPFELGPNPIPPGGLQIAGYSGSFASKAGSRVTGIQAGYPKRLGERPHEFISRVKRRCEEIAKSHDDPRPAIRAELATAKAVFKQEYGEDLDMAIGLDGGEWVR